MSEGKRTFVITGGTGGIGLHSAIGIAKSDTNNIRVIITGRNQERGEVAVKRIQEEANNKDIELVIGDVTTTEGVDALAKAIIERTDGKLDVLINNAGYLGDKLLRSDDGLEMHFAVNVRSPYRLIMALLPALKQGTESRVVNVTGGSEKPGPIDVDNLQAEKGFKGLLTYMHSKCAEEAMTMAVAKKLEPESIMVHVVFPGAASTAMTAGFLSQSSLPGFMKIFYPFFWFLFRDDGGKSAAKASISTIFAATTPKLTGVTGKFFDSKAIEHKLDPTAYDENVQARIIELIESATKNEK